MAFVILWMKAYLSSAEWAANIFKFIKFEKKFVDKRLNILLDKMIPQDQDQVPFRKKFVRNCLNG